MAPGPGRWARDAARYPRPVTPTLARILPRAALRGFSAATRPYGLLLDHIEWAFVDGWAYMTPRRIAPLRGEHLDSQQAWDAVVECSAELRHRLNASSRVFERRIWRGELARWYRHDRPDSIACNTAIASRDTGSLDDLELVRHLSTCRINVARAIHRHHRYDVTPAVAVGDLLAHVADWTGSPSAEHLDLLASSSRTALAATDLLAVAGGWWIAGSTVDIDELTFSEISGAVADALRDSARARARADGDARDAASDVRAQIPNRFRGAFDEMLADARAVHRVRDERALYCDVWAMGLLRRVVLCAGERLCDRGVLETPPDSLEAGPAELRAMLLRPRTAGDLASRMRQRGAARRSADGSAIPDELGDPSWTPIPVRWLPAGAVRTERAFRTFLSAMEAASEAPATDDLRGLAASPGVHVGRARIVRGAADLERIEAGDVLVSPAASSALVVAFPLAGAMVTDHGGMLSHAANLAREYGLPAVVGTGDATRRIRDGATVRVDGGAGLVVVVTA